MDIIKLLNNKSLKSTEKRAIIVEGLVKDEISLDQLVNNCKSLNEKQIAIILEAIEEITNKNIKQLDSAYLSFAEQFILSDNCSCKREASRIVGNLAQQYPHELETAVQALLKNTDDESTVVRWGSAYALSRIITLSEFAESHLFDKISEICEKEQENGVKNQYIKGLKKAMKLRTSKE